jgi:hypothetical protein
MAKGYCHHVYQQPFVGRYFYYTADTATAIHSFFMPLYRWNSCISSQVLLAEFDSLDYENNCELDINGNGQRLMPTEDEDKNTTSFTENVSIKVYPNPANNIINIELPTKALTTIEMCNTIGEIVVKKEVNTLLPTIDIENLPLGFYTIRIRSGDIIFNDKILLIR